MDFLFSDAVESLLANELKDIKDGSDEGLFVGISEGKLTISVGINTLAKVAENLDAFWDGVSGVDVPNVIITSPPLFAKSIVGRLNTEGEDGTNLVTRMLDNAMIAAIEDGCDGVDHEEKGT